MARELEPWGGDVHLPRWLHRLLRRPDGPEDTTERIHERHKPQQPTASVAENADRAMLGALSRVYREGRTKRPT